MSHIRHLEDFETGEEIEDQSYITLSSPKKYGVILSKNTIKKALDKIMNCKKAKFFKRDLKARFYKVHSISISPNKSSKPRLLGYLKERDVIEYFPQSYVFSQGKMTLNF
jgi:hypothetical protein